MNPRINVEKIPEYVNKQAVYSKAAKLSKLNFFKEHLLKGQSQFKLTYLGGCSNHALVCMDDDNTYIVRLPGSQSEILIDRYSEIHNQTIVATKLNLCPPIIEAPIQGSLAGYKIEYKILGEPLNFEDFSSHQKLALNSIKKVHDSGEKFETEYNVFNRIILMSETLLNDGVNYLSWDKRQNSILLTLVIQLVQSLSDKFNELFGQSNLVPCHNDLAPANFILVDDSIQIIDWETSGMNDNMFDLAYIASVNDLSYDQIKILVSDYYQDNMPHTNEINKVFFLQAIVDLNIGVWSFLQTYMRNESKPHELRNGWGPEYTTKFFERLRNEQFQQLIGRLDTLTELFDSSRSYPRTLKI